MVNKKTRLQIFLAIFWSVMCFAVIKYFPTKNLELVKNSQAKPIHKLIIESDVKRNLNFSLDGFLSKKQFQKISSGLRDDNDFILDVIFLKIEYNNSISPTMANIYFSVDGNDSNSINEIGISKLEIESETLIIK